MHSPSNYTGWVCGEKQTGQTARGPASANLSTPGDLAPFPSATAHAAAPTASSTPLSHRAAQPLASVHQPLPAIIGLSQHDGSCAHSAQQVHTAQVFESILSCLQAITQRCARQVRVRSWGVIYSTVLLPARVQRTSDGRTTRSVQRPARIQQLTKNYSAALGALQVL